VMVHTSVTTQTDLDTPTCWVSYWHAHIFHVRNWYSFIQLKMIRAYMCLTCICVCIYTKLCSTRPFPLYLSRCLSFFLSLISFYFLDSSSLSIFLLLFFTSLLPVSPPPSTQLYLTGSAFL